jgi:hypothetical protein
LEAGPVLERGIEAMEIFRVTRHLGSGIRHGDNVTYAERVA